MIEVFDELGVVSIEIIEVFGFDVDVGKFLTYYIPTGRSGKSVLLILRQVCGVVGGLMEGDGMMNRIGLAVVGGAFGGLVVVLGELLIEASK